MIAKFFAILVSFFILAGCAQSIDDVSIIARHPSSSTYVFVADGDHQGGNSEPALSLTTSLSAQALGGNVMRTTSSSPSFTMTSGIGVD